MMNLSSRIKAGALVALAFGILGCKSDPQYSSTLNIAFSPMYSGYDGVHTYQIPATINNTNGPVTWSASDKSMVDLTPDPNGIDVMITTKKAGKVTIQAVDGDAIGKSTLTIEAFTTDQWAAGMNRYTSGTIVSLGQAVHGMGTKDAQCAGCHGDTATSSAIEHTPEQTGGYTDDQITNIFLNGVLPTQDQSNSLFVSPMFFKSFHTWTVASPDEQAGLIAYLRSLAPKAQGQLDFGGGGRGDGGMRPPRDMAGAPPPATDM
ncbi:MAG TPA: hypothetical protein VHB97_10860 [Polyangia bacterium]|nr:hypothetical protein [Polyangia bacterium]